MMKYVLVIGDGMADNPVPELGNKTPLQVVNKDAIDQLARKGTVGSVVNCPKGLPAGSDTAILSIFGNSETYEKASQQLQKAIQSGLKPSLESAAKSVAKDLAQPVAWWAVYGLSFCLILLVWELVSKLLNLVAKLPVLNLANRLMGGGVGLLKGALVVGLVCVLVLRFGLVTAAETKESVFLQFFSNFSWARG